MKGATAARIGTGAFWIQISILKDYSISMPEKQGEYVNFDL